MLVERNDNEVVSERLDRAASSVACVLASMSVVGTLRVAHFAYGACPSFPDACVPAVLGTLFGCVMSLALGGACYLFRPTD